MDAHSTTSAPLSLPLSSAARAAEHAELERQYIDLLSSYLSGEWDDVRRQWSLFEPAVRRHLNIEQEERELFAEFRMAAPAEADALAKDHRELRELIDMIGIGIDLHSAPERDARDLVNRLRAHAQREERCFYPWLDNIHKTREPKIASDHAIADVAPR